MRKKKLTEKQRDNRKTARFFGMAALSNIRFALTQQKDADEWTRIGDQVEKREGPEDSATQECRKRAAASQAIAEHQTAQAGVNAQRAFRWARESEQPNWSAIAAKPENASIQAEN